MTDIQTIQDEPDKSLLRLFALISLLGLSAYTLGHLSTNIKNELNLWFK